MVFEKDSREFCSLLNEEKIDYPTTASFRAARVSKRTRTTDVS
jgi:hypothetical protein